MLSGLITIIIVSWTVPDRSADAPSDPPLHVLTANVYPDSVSTEQEYIEWLEQHDQELAGQTGEASPAIASRLLAHHANWTLAVRCEPYMTRILLRVTRAGDVSALDALGKDALDRLTRAKAQWPNEDIDGLERVELLTHFARAISLFAGAKAGQPDQDSIEETASELAIWVDDDDLDVANAALLWHGLLYHAIGKSQRSLRTLPLALAPIDGKSSGLYVRLSRCSILADMGRTALALSLLMKMEERCSVWFVNEADQKSALCALTLLRIQIAKTLNAELGELSQKTMADLVARAEEVLQDEEQPCKLLRMGKTVPMLLTKPEGEPDVAPAKSDPVSPPAPSTPQTPPQDKK